MVLLPNVNEVHLTEQACEDGEIIKYTFSRDPILGGAYFSCWSNIAHKPSIVDIIMTRLSFQAGHQENLQVSNENLYEIGIDQILIWEHIIKISLKN